MAWYDEAVFYHIYPLGLTGAPEKNPGGEPVPRLNALIPWIDHIREIGCAGLYIGPLFESGSHGYDTADYRKVDRRLGTNGDLQRFVALCHGQGIRVILDAVFNHTGREFFAFRDLREKKQSSPYADWYCRVDFGGNNEFGDGFSYENWGGYNLLPKLNLLNPSVREYLLDTVRFWAAEFDIDGLRLDAADVLDFDFMRSLREAAREIREDFWLMGEVIHGDYGRWANGQTLHAVTNYHLHKALYSAHNDHNYFEIAHTVRRQAELLAGGAGLYNFADNHDVDRIMTKLHNPAHFLPVQVLLYTLPGIPSVYYGSEFGIEGRKEHGSDAPIRPCLSLAALKSAANPYLEFVTALGRVRRAEGALRHGPYREMHLTTTQYAFARGDVIVTVNNSDAPAFFDLAVGGAYKGALKGASAASENGRLHIEIGGNSGEIWIPQNGGRASFEPIRQHFPVPSPKEAAPQPRRAAAGKAYEQMSIEELQSAIVDKLAANGPVTDRMRREVMENVYRDSLLNWVRSFR